MILDLPYLLTRIKIVGELPSKLGVATRVHVRPSLNTAFALGPFSHA